MRCFSLACPCLPSLPQKAQVPCSFLEFRDVAPFRTGSFNSARSLPARPQTGSPTARTAAAHPVTSSPAQKKSSASRMQSPRRSPSVGAKVFQQPQPAAFSPASEHPLGCSDSYLRTLPPLDARKEPGKCSRSHSWRLLLGTARPAPPKPGRPGQLLKEVAVQ